MTGGERTRRGSSLAPMLALLAAALLLSPVGPFPLLAIPFALMLAAFRPRDLFGIVAAVVLLVLAFRAVAWEADAGWYMLRGWCLLAGGLFVGATVLRKPHRLLDRSFSAVAVTTVLLVVGSFAWPELGSSLDGWMSARIRDASNMAHAILLSDPQVASGALGDSISSAIDGWASFQHDVYPALLALATMAALALGWYFAGRHGEDFERPPPVREFGFRDGYVWILVAGLALLVLPLGAEAFRAGENAALFMALLYLARGGAILFWITAAATTSAWTWVLLAVCALLAYPFVFGAALVLGIGDTWLHVREKMAAGATNGPGRGR